MRKHILWSLVLACLFVVAAAPAMAGPRDSIALVPQLTMDKAALTTADNVNVRFSLANQSNATVRYRLGGKTYTIAPRQVTTHTQCRKEALKFDWPGPGREATLTPGNGDKLAVVRGGSGFSVKNE